MYRQVTAFLTVFLLSVSIGQIIVGQKYGECSFEPQLPVFLKASGSVGIPITVISIIVIVAADDDNKFILGHLVLQSLFFGSHTYSW